MSALAPSRWGSRNAATVAAIPLAEDSKKMAMRERMRIVGDTALVLGLQLVFRATMVLRRWNY
jgi:hypothetical protein